MAAPTASQQRPSPGESTSHAVVPFRRGSGWGRYQFGTLTSQTLTTVTQPLSPIDVKAYDYMRSILLLVETTTTSTIGSLASLSADGPFNLFGNISVTQPNGQTMYQVSSGYHAFVIHKYGMHRRYFDPRDMPAYSWTLGTGGSASRSFRSISSKPRCRSSIGAAPTSNS